MAKDLAIILTSGSLHSAVTTALAAQRHRLVMVYALSSEKGALRKRAAYEQQVAHFKPYRDHVVAAPFNAPTPPRNESGSASPDPRQGLTLAPQMIELLPLLAIGARFAAQYQASAIYLGLRVGVGGDELAQATEYIQIWNELVQLPCGQPELEVLAPLLELEGWQVVDLGLQVGAPLEHTWSCAEEGDVPCGSCRDCRARQAAFQQSGKPDPLQPARR